MGVNISEWKTFTFKSEMRENNLRNESAFKCSQIHRKKWQP